MSERAKAQIRESAPKPAYRSISTYAELQSVKTSDATEPLVILGEAALGNYTMAECAASLRKRGVRNPIIFYTPDRIVSSIEKAEFLNEGGDTVIDKSDIGSKSEDPNQDAILVRMAALLRNTAGARNESRNRTVLTPDMQLDSASRTFYVKNERILLSGFQTRFLLAFFKLRAESRDGLVSTEKFVLEVYGKDTDEIRDRLTAMISSQINKKLRPHGFELRAKPYSGYAFVPVESA